MALDKSELETSIKAPLKDKIKEHLDTEIPIPADGEEEGTPSAATPANEMREKFSKAIADAVADVVSEKVIEHILAKLEVKGIEVTVPASTFSTGAGTAAAPVTSPVALNQSNDGTGRIA